MKNTNKILAIDPATLSGWAVSQKEFGLWNLSRKRDESWGMSLIKFRTHIKQCLKEHPAIELIAYERVTGINANAVMTHSKLIGVIEIICVENNLQHVGYSAGTIKKFATGMGNAKKPEMIAAAKKLYGYDGGDDNVADALHLLHLTKKDFLI